MVSDAGCFLPGHYLQSEEKAKDGKNVYRPDSRICMGRFRAMRIADFMCIYDLLESAYTLCDPVDDGDGNYFNRTNYNMKLVTVSGVLGIFASLGCLYIDKFDQILLFALAFVFMMVIPGHYLNIMSKRGV